MIISKTFTLDGPRARVAALLVDVESIQSCVPGVSHVSKTADEGYEATLSIQVGPIKPSFRGSVTINTADSPERLRATARGKDGASGSMATVTFDALLIESGPATTTVETTADVTIRGRLGTFGTGVIQATAKQLIGEFVSCVNTQLTAPESTTNTTAPRSIPIFRTLIRAMWARLKSFFKHRRKQT